MQCPSCGSQLPSNAKFCGSCGHTLQAASVPPAAAPQAAANVPAVSAGSVSGGLTPAKTYDEIMTAPLNISITDCYKEAWELAKPNLGVLIGGMLVWSFGFGLVYLLCMILIGIPLIGPMIAGPMIVALRLVQGEEIGIGDFFAGFKKLVPLAITPIVLGVAFFLSVFTIVGPYYLLYAAGWTMYIIVDRDEEWMEAIKSSLRVSNRMFLDLVGYQAAGGFVNLIGALACGLGTIVTAPVTLVAKAVLYKKVFGITGGAARLE